MTFIKGKNYPNTGRTRFKKGITPWNKGLKGVMKAWNKGIPSKYKGIPRTEEVKKKISLANKGRKRLDLIGNQWNKGREGKLAANWKHGLSNTKEYFQHKCLERRVRKKGAIGFHTLEEWLLLKSYYQYMCLCCKRKEPEIKLSEDHIVPLVMGGTDYIDNIQPLCRSCNSRKHTKVINYRVWKGGEMLITLN